MRRAILAFSLGAGCAAVAPPTPPPVAVIPAAPPDAQMAVFAQSAPR